MRIKNCLWQPCLLPDRDEISNLCRESSIDAFYQVRAHLAKRTFHRCFLPSFGSLGQAVSEENILKNWPIRNNNCLWRPCLLMDRDKMCNLYRGHSIDASYQVSVHLDKQFQRRRFFFRNQPIRNKNWLLQPRMLTDQDKINNLYRRPSIDAS